MSTSHRTSILMDTGLQADDRITDQLLTVVSNHVYPSERRDFATERLGIREPRYEMIEEDESYALARNRGVNDIILQHTDSLRMALDLFKIDTRSYSWLRLGDKKESLGGVVQHPPS